MTCVTVRAVTKVIISAMKRLLVVVALVALDVVSPLSASANGRGAARICERLLLERGAATGLGSEAASSTRAAREALMPNGAAAHTQSGAARVAEILTARSALHLDPAVVNTACSGVCGYAQSRVAFVKGELSTSDGSSFRVIKDSSQFHVLHRGAELGTFDSQPDAVRAIVNASHEHAARPSDANLRVWFDGLQPEESRLFFNSLRARHLGRVTATNANAAVVADHVMIPSVPKVTQSSTLGHYSLRVDLTPDRVYADELFVEILPHHGSHGTLRSKIGAFIERLVALLRSISGLQPTDIVLQAVKDEMRAAARATGIELRDIRVLTRRDSVNINWSELRKCKHAPRA